MSLKLKSGSVVTEPKVFMVGVQDVNWEKLQDFLNSECFREWESGAKEASEILTEVAGRLCYMSFSGGRNHADYIENIREHKHGSVLEHAAVSFIITGVSRTLTHELVRHRAGWSYSQLSQRYVDHDHCQFVCPKDILECKDHPIWGHVYKNWVEACSLQRTLYECVRDSLIHKFCRPDGEAVSSEDFEAGKKKHRKRINGASRSLLPACTETKIFCTVNARALRHFVEMRATPEADTEIRELAICLYNAVLSEMPAIFSDYELYDHPEAGNCLRSKHRKV